MQIPNLLQRGRQRSNRSVRQSRKVWVLRKVRPTVSYPWALSGD